MQDREQKNTAATGMGITSICEDYSGQRWAAKEGSARSMRKMEDAAPTDNMLEKLAAHWDGCK